MKAEKQKVAMLKRIRRLRIIEKMTVQRELAEARQSENKFRELHERSAEMAAQYSSRLGHKNAAELSQSLGLANALSQIGLTAQNQGHDAQAMAERISQRMARLDHQEDRLSEKITEIERTIDAREQNEQAITPHLARPLLNRDQS